MLQGLTGQCALITGATRGIGRAIAERLAQAGASLGIVGTDLQRCTAVAAEISKAYQVEAIPFACDVAQTAQAEQTLEAMLEAYGKIDILVNNAGITRDSLLIRLDEQDWDAVINTNLKGVYNFCKPAARAMMKAKYGRIINISSVVALCGNAGQCNYAAAKAGIIGFSKSLARELAARNICVNVIAPGFINTDMTEALPEQIKEKLKDSIPAKRIGKPEEIAETVAFLCAQNSAYITGQIISVDGGMNMA
ncbi:MAG: 3-oxoacyl-[acyl-carrier-protein] reductase [Lentisphaeria bacterium]|jgi:3-oxoacyl-[acyl-carrier protein] reductase|nr:3-oxoacyl-[acyl-carrier-protein] reductase [Lentisphaeria bacterium]MDY0176769.1 3-oxoacyl-[acyl-carrier-protein] reductase [Lentisphaeria bacterium]NLZ60219.1 3-oxoacyl-[acyl-carrier-protein] reductase [Lentisphaerota bacterium]